MASITMASFPTGAVAVSGGRLPANRAGKQQLVAAKASSSNSSHETNEQPVDQLKIMNRNTNGADKKMHEISSSSSNGRREMVFAAAATAAAAMMGMGGAAFAEEPKPGSPEAKKIYAPVCVTMPTARICRK